jgi:hypothetical protein
MTKGGFAAFVAVWAALWVPTAIVAQAPVAAAPAPAPTPTRPKPLTTPAAQVPASTDHPGAGVDAPALPPAAYQPTSPDEEQRTMSAPVRFPALATAAHPQAGVTPQATKKASRRDRIALLRSTASAIELEDEGAKIFQACRCWVAGGSNGVPVTDQRPLGFQVEIFLGPAVPASNIVGGDDPSVPPWELRHVCGGALIAHDWVLTAAHCVRQDLVDAGLEVRLGADDIAHDDGIVIKVDRMERHPKYRDDDMYDYDIALLHLVPDRRPRASYEIRQISIPRRPIASGSNVYAVGWGKIDDTNEQPVAILRRFDMQSWDQKTCMDQPGYGPTKVHDGVLCAGAFPVKTCRGDSGGPLALTRPRGSRATPELVGIVSWNKTGCDGRNDWRPGVYTRVASYIDWIKATERAKPLALR